MKNRDMPLSYASGQTSIVAAQPNPSPENHIEIKTLVRFPNGEVLKVDAHLDVLSLVRVNDAGLSMARDRIEEAIKTQSREICRIVRLLDLWRLLSAH